MLIKPTIDELEEKTGNRHVLAIFAAKRARDLALGKRPLGENPDYNPVSQAASEIAEGLITYTDTRED